MICSAPPVFSAPPPPPLPLTSKAVAAFESEASRKWATAKLEAIYAMKWAVRPPSPFLPLFPDAALRADAAVLCADAVVGRARRRSQADSPLSLCSALILNTSSHGASHPRMCMGSLQGIEDVPPAPVAVAAVAAAPKEARPASVDLSYTTVDVLKAAPLVIIM